MAKFDLSKKKAKKSDEPRKRKVKRRKKTTDSLQRKQYTLDLIPVTERFPPDEPKQIITWENDIGWFLNDANLTLQHIKADINMFGYSRVRYWAFLD